jgi:hypothetical protein
VTEPVAGHEDHPVRHGEETFRAFGELWVQSAGDIGFGPIQMTLGFDPETRRFVGTYIGATMPHLWRYDGALAPGEDRLVLKTTGPSFLEEGKQVPYRDEIELVSPDERVLRAWIQGPDGAWSQFHQTRFRRV